MTRRLSTAIAALLLLTLAIFAQRYGGGVSRGDDEEITIPKRNAEFHFLRMEYTDHPAFHRRFGWVSRDGQGNGWWMQDWPTAENHFTVGVQRLTRLDTGDPRHLRVTDDRIFDYPWIYATQTGWWNLTDAETVRLREYLERGGFLMVDDFWGPEQWELFRATMDRVLPNHPITDIELDDSVMNVLYNIQQKDLTFIPDSRHLRRTGSGVEVVQPEGMKPAWKAIYDDKNRMVVAVNFNTDIGDAWEFADVPEYPEAMTSLAYKYGINYIMYALTH
jgi:hypothetical protein